MDDARGSVLLQRRWIGIAPHVVDSVVLTSAIAHAVMLQHLIVAELSPLMIGLRAGFSAGEKHALDREVPTKTLIWIKNKFLYSAPN